ncbi:Pyruvate kinase [bioreactor metagenome]|uniref:Pyruvate kinase n=1 Tax=bioreactor metagenome TaxID=1076179 RepID=A0A645HYK5_9ZZZZ
MVWRQLNLVWGCKPVLVHELKNSNEAFSLAMQTAIDSGIAKNGDTVVVAMGVPVGISGTTNTLRVGIVGDVLCKGIGITKKKVSAKARVINTLDEAEKKFKMGDILVTSSTRNDMMPYIKKASAIVVGPIEHVEGSHAEIVGNALDIPVVICNSRVTSIVPDDTIITVDAEKGFIYEGIPMQN